MQDVDLGGCPEMSKLVGSSPITDSIVVDSTKTIPFTHCQICGTPLKWGSNDFSEDRSCYWCPQCDYGPVFFPMYGGPESQKKPIAPVIDAEKANLALHIVDLLRSRP